MLHSLSKLGTFEKCSKRYEFQYVLNYPRAQNKFASRGVDTHKVVEDYISGNLPALPSDLAFYTNFLDGIRSIPGILPEAKLAVNENWEPVAWDAPDVWIRSVLDLLVPPQSGTLHIYDWKTGKIYDDHKDQRELYTIVSAPHYPDALEISATHVYLDINKNERQVFHRDHLVELRERWARRFRALETATEFVYNPSYACRWCPFSKAAGGPCPF